MDTIINLEYLRGGSDLLLKQILIKQVEESDDVYVIENAISNLLSLTQDGPQLCSIIAKVRKTNSAHLHH